MVRFSMSIIVFVSFVFTTLVVSNAFLIKKQFYPSVVYITKSSSSMAVIHLQAAIVSYLIFTLIRRIFFGQLRPAEIEHAQEKVWHALMETCLAFTVFRDDFSPKFVVQFVLLFFVKAFHWLAEDRVDYMERSPVITLLFHARIMGILSLLTAIDSYFISHAFFTTLTNGPSAQIVFGFEYAVLLTVIANIVISYILHMHDLRSPNQWENKAVYMLYAELLTSFLRCCLYLAFTFVMIKIHAFPLFVIRPFYLTARAFRKALNDVIQSRRAINAMNNLFPFATAEELAQTDSTCIICREEMTIESGVKKLPCNHIFHPNCLRSWFQRQQTCPTCRTDILAIRHPAPTVNLGFAAGFNAGQPPAQQQQPYLPFNMNLMNNIFNPTRQPQQQPVFAAPTGQANGNLPQQQLFGGPPLAHMGQYFGFPPPPHFFPTPQQPHPFTLSAGLPPNVNMNASSSTTTSTNISASSSQNGAINQSPGSSTSTETTTNQHQQQQSTTSPIATTTTTDQPPSAASPPLFSSSQARQQGNHSLQFSPIIPNTSLPSLSGIFPSANFPMFPFPTPPMFSGLTDSEIAEMEGNQRRALEARIQTLSNISTLLDAAVLQFQQYMAIPQAQLPKQHQPQSPANSETLSPSTSTDASIAREQP